MLYSEHIEQLAAVAKTIESIGIELYEDGDCRKQGYEHDVCTIYKQTLRSCHAEVTVNLYAGKILFPHEYEFIASLHAGVDYAIEVGEKVMENPLFEENLSNISKLANQCVSLADWYEVLIYLGYDLPECDWIYDY